jgi:hypothetical protein
MAAMNKGIAMKRSIVIRRLTAAFADGAVLAPAADAATPPQLLDGYGAQAGSPPSPDRGQQLLTLKP